MNLKQMMTKKRLFVGVITISSLVFIAVVSVPQKNTTTTNQSPGKKININTGITEQEYVIEFAIENWGFLNETDELIKKPKTISNEKIVEIAGNLGYLKESLRTKDVYDGEVVIYSDELASLIFKPEIGEIRYTLNNLIEENQQFENTNEYLEVASSFLVNNSLLEKNSFSHTSTFFLNSSQEYIKPTTPLLANIIQSNFSPGREGFQIYTVDPLESPISIRLTSNKKVFSVSLFNTEVIKSGNRLKLLTQDETEKAIYNATIISLDDGNYVLSDIPKKEIEKIVLNEVSFGYLWESAKSTNLPPIYIFKGTALLKKERREVSVVMYLAASK